MAWLGWHPNCARIYLRSMPSDGARFRFLADHKLSVVWYDDGVSISWRERWPEPGQTAGYRMLSRARTLAEAVDVVIKKYLRKHRVTEETADEPPRVRVLQVRGWLS